MALETSRALSLLFLHHEAHQQLFASNEQRADERYEFYLGTYHELLLVVVISSHGPYGRM